MGAVDSGLGTGVAGLHALGHRTKQRMKARSLTTLNKCEDSKLKLEEREVTIGKGLIGGLVGDLGKVRRVGRDHLGQAAW